MGVSKCGKISTMETMKTRSIPWALALMLAFAAAPWAALAADAADGPADEATQPAAEEGDEAAPAQRAAPTASTEEEPSRTNPRRRMVSPLDQRIALLGKELDLDERQKAEVRKILLQQSEEIRATWGNTTQPAAVRIAASRAIGDKTADRIRALLNDKQREKYIKPRPKVPDHAQAPEKVEGWINAVGSH